MSSFNPMGVNLYKPTFEAQVNRILGHSIIPVLGLMSFGWGVHESSCRPYLELSQLLPDWLDSIRFDFCVVQNLGRVLK